MSTTCTPTIIDRTYGRGQGYALCPDCGAIVAVDARPGDATAIPAHPIRVPGAPVILDLTDGPDAVLADILAVIE